MRKILLALLFLNFATTEAKEALRAEESILVENGRIQETGVLTDEKGTVFLEFLEGSLINYTEDKQPFSGEIMPPAIIDRPEKFPRARMREVLTFEFLTDNADEVSLVDRYTLMHAKEYLRETMENPDGLVYSSGIKVLTRVYESDEVGLPSLWRLETKEDENDETINYWKKIGGKLNKTEEDEVQVFSAIITRTGIYGLFDEDPAPYYSENTPLETVERVAESPFPSVVPQSPELPVDEASPEDEMETDPLLDEASEDDFLPMDEDFLSDPETEDPRIIPAVEPLPETPIIPAVVEERPLEEFPLEGEITEPETEEAENQMLAADSTNIPLLPVAGPLAEGATSSRFPLVLFLAFGLLGFSVYLALKKEQG